MSTYVLPLLDFSYARRDSPTYDPYKRWVEVLCLLPSKYPDDLCLYLNFWSFLISLRPESESSSESRSHSHSPGPEKITFITSFGGSDDEAVAATQTAAPHSGHTSSNSQHPAGHSRGSRSVTFHLCGFSLVVFLLVDSCQWNDYSCKGRKNTDDEILLW